MGVAFYMGVFEHASTKVGMKKLFQLMAFVSLLYGVILFIGYLTGAKSLFHPLDKFTTQKSIQNSSTSVSKKGYSIAKLLEEVKASSKPVVVDFRKKSCGACDELEELTFSNLAVKEELKRFTFISIDVTEDTDDEKALMKKYHIVGTPAILFFNKKNSELSGKRVTGFIEADKFLKYLKTM